MEVVVEGLVQTCVLRTVVDTLEVCAARVNPSELHGWRWFAIHDIPAERIACYLPPVRRKRKKARRTGGGWSIT
jgi:hypothetical protein